MANRIFNPAQALDKEVKILAGKISINSSAAVTACTILGAGAARTAAGTYDITLDDVYPELLAAHVQVQAATAVDLVAQVVSYVVATKILKVKLLAAATATDPSAACDLYVTVVLKNSGVTP